MINQSINLYQDRFRKKKIWFSSAQATILLLLTVITLSALSYWFERQLVEATNYNLAIKQQQQQLSDELQVANAELKRLLDDNSKALEIESVTNEIVARKRILSFVDSNQFGSGEGFSASLNALSRLNIDNIWLNEIHLAEDYLSIKGSSLKAESVPVYFNGFRQEEIFDGSRFDIFTVDRQKDTDWKVDFEIATHDRLDG